MISLFLPLSRSLLSQSLRLRGPVSQFALRSIKRKAERLEEWRVRRVKQARKSSLQHSSASLNGTETLNSYAGQTLHAGLVIERHGDRLVVETKPSQILPGGTTANEGESSTIVCSQRSSLCDTTIVVGDVVDFFYLDPVQPRISADATQPHDVAAVVGIPAPTVESDSGSFQGVVVSHRERRTLLQRPTSSSGGMAKLQMKALAANVDQLVVVVASNPYVPPISIDRLLVAATEYNLDALIVLNKVELEGADELAERLENYVALGYPVLKVSVKEGYGLDDLRAALNHKCSIFVGQSGVGKSSLVNILLPDAHANVGELVKKGTLGAHTTSSARLFHLPDGGSIVDSPGIRELGLWHLDAASIRAGFIEIAELSAHCKFKNCAHTRGTLGCAVIRAVEEGKVHPERLSNFLALTQ